MVWNIKMVIPHTIKQEKNIPMVFAAKARFLSMPKRNAAIVPAYTPVPGIGIITKINKPQNPNF